MLINIPVFIFIAVICSLDGLVIFAVYSNCDLAKEGKITRNDQVRKINFNSTLTRSGDVTRGTFFCNFQLNSGADACYLQVS